MVELVVRPLTRHLVMNPLSWGYFSESHMRALSENGWKHTVAKFSAGGSKGFGCFQWCRLRMWRRSIFCPRPVTPPGLTGSSSALAPQLLYQCAVPRVLPVFQLHRNLLPSRLRCAQREWTPILSAMIARNKIKEKKSDHLSTGPLVASQATFLLWSAETILVLTK